MDEVTVYLLTSLSIERQLDKRNVGVTFDLFEAEAYKGRGVENDFTFEVRTNWREDAEQSKLIVAMREFPKIVNQIQAEALR